MEYSTHKAFRDGGVICLCLFLLSGCKVYDAGAGFVSQRYVNAISYFNTYYNAQRAFDDAEKEILAGQRTQQGRSATTAAIGPVSQTARTKFNTAIEKASKILSYYPTCKWVDDALFIIGKSYYYLDDDLKAERKFLELFAKYPWSDLRLEAELWYGRSLLRQKRFAEGVQLLDNLFAKGVESGERDIAAMAARLLGSHFFEKQEYEKAIKYFQETVATSRDDNVRAEAQMQLGYCYKAMKDLTRASQAFLAVDEFGPDYGTAFSAKFEYVKILSELRRYDEALAGLRQFLADAKNADNFAKVNFEIGNVYLSQNRTDDAVQKFTYVDTAFARTDEAAKAYYNLGEIYESTEHNYAQARSNFDKARFEYPSSEITADAVRKSDAYAKYFGLKIELTKYDSLIADFAGRRAKRDSLNMRREASQTGDTISAVGFLRARSKSDAGEPQAKLRAKRDSLARLDSTRKATELTLEAYERRSIDSLRQLIVKSEFELAGIFYLEINEPDSALYWYQKVIDKGSRDDLAPRALFTMEEIYRTSKGKEKSFLDSLYTTIVAKYPESPYAQESRRALGLPLLEARKDPAADLYSRAETYMGGMSPDSALPLLSKIIREDASSPFSAKALYAMGWLYENKLDKRDSASAVYRRLVAAFPESQFANAVRPKILEEDNARKEEERKAKEELEAKKKREAEQKKEEGKRDESSEKPKVSEDKP